MGGLAPAVWLLAVASAPVEIVRVTPGAAVLDAGRVDGLAPGDVVEIDRQVEVDLPDRGLAALRPMGRTAVRAVGSELSLVQPLPGARPGDRVRLVQQRVSLWPAFPRAAARQPSPRGPPARPPG
jgi:hypothetical protein